MSMVRDFFNGFVDGIMNGTANQERASNFGASSPGRIERLCRELGWSVDEREGNMIRLHFKGSNGEVRKVRIAGCDKSLVSLFVLSDAVLPLRRVSQGIMAYLLRRNSGDSGIGMWGMNVDDDDDATFLVYYMALGEGLDAEALKYICESLSSEASEFDEKLQEAGLLD